MSVGAIRAADKETKKKNQGNLKRAVDSYSYPLPAVQFDDAKSGNTKTKVIVETIKSISPPEYLPPDGKKCFIGISGSQECTLYSSYEIFGFYYT